MVLVDLEERKLEKGFDLDCHEGEKKWFNKGEMKTCCTDLASWSEEEKKGIS